METRIQKQWRQKKKEKAPRHWQRHKTLLINYESSFIQFHILRYKIVQARFVQQVIMNKPGLFFIITQTITLDKTKRFQV